MSAVSRASQPAALAAMLAVSALLATSSGAQIRGGGRSTASYEAAPAQAFTESGHTPLTVGMPFGPTGLSDSMDVSAVDGTAYFLQGGGETDRGTLDSGANDRFRSSVAFTPATAQALSSASAPDFAEAPVVTLPAVSAGRQTSSLPLLCTALTGLFVAFKRRLSI